MEEQRTRHDLTSQIVDILAQYVGNERVVVKEEDNANIVTLCEDESLNIEIYDGDSLIVWLFSYENNIIRDNNEDALETVKWLLEDIFTKPNARIKTYKANKLVKDVYKFDEYSFTDYSHLLWGLLHWGKKREETTIISYDAETRRFTEALK